MTTKLLGTIAADETYTGQAQPIGGAANTANPPLVEISAMPPISVTSAEIVGGALNTATPPTVNVGNSAAVYPADSAAVDAFSRQRVSLPNGLLDAKFRFNKLPLIYDEYSAAKNGGSGTVTHIPNDACVQLEITAGSVKSPAMTSHQTFLYRAGQSMLVLATFVANPVGAPMAAGATKRVGYYDKKSGGDGLYLQLTYDGTDLNDLTLPEFVTASTASAGGEVVPQSAWNVDKMDGSGASGINLNFNYSQILVIDFQFLGVGRVRWGFDIDGQIYWAHYSRNANEPGQTSVYMKSGCLPIRFEIFGNANAKMNVICQSVLREGGEAEPAYKGVISTESVSAAGNTFPNVATGLGSSILAVRLKPGFTGAYFSLNSISVTNTSNAQIYWEAVLVRGYPATGADFTWVSLDDAVEYSTTQVSIATISAALVDGLQTRIDCGVLIASGNLRVSAQQNLTTKILQTASANSANSASGGAIAPSMDILLIQGRGMGAAGTGHAVIEIDEYY